MASLVSGSHADILEAKGFAFVATLDPRQRPNVSPTWYLWDGERQRLLISLTSTRQKYRNLVRRPEVAVCLMVPDNPYRYVEMRGRADEIEADEDHRLIDALARKYVGRDKFAHDPADGDRAVVRIAADYVRCFG